MVGTLVESLASLPRGQERGFRFIKPDGEEVFHSYEALERESRRRASQLLTLGFQRGDRIALVIGDPESFVLTFLAAVIAGFTPVPLAPRRSLNLRAKQTYAQTVCHIVRSARARLVLTESSLQVALEEGLEQGGVIGRVVTLESLLAIDAPQTAFPELAPDDLCFLQFTSGSTALPKGIMVTHANLIANARAFMGPHGLALRRDDVAVAWLPLYHDMGLIGFVLGTLICDLPTVLLSTEAFVRHPGIWMNAIGKYHGTVTFAPNFAYALAVRRLREQDIAGLDLSRLRVAGCGAEPVNASTLREFCDAFSPAGFKAAALLPCYGMAEATLAISFHDHDKPIFIDTVSRAGLRSGAAIPADSYTDDTTELVACGRPFPGHELQIVDELGKSCSERRVGEIITRGPSVTSGYFDQPDARSFRDGWLCTGDLGYIADGRLYICGRSKDLIIIRGFNYHPQDIEWAVATLPGVLRNGAVAIGVTRGGEETMIVCVEGLPSVAGELRRTVTQRVFEVAGLAPAQVVVVPAGGLPRTSSGKFQRAKTKTLFESGALGKLCALGVVAA
jgi:fatty-acyl-CoA synthase